MEDRLKPSKSAAGDSTALSAQDAEALLARKLEEVRFCDYFTILELRPDEPLPEGAAQGRYRSIVARFDGLRGPPARGEDSLERLAEVLSGLEEAREVLADKDLRERYRASLDKNPAARL